MPEAGQYAGEVLKAEASSDDRRVNFELPSDYLHPRWYAAYTAPRHEKRVTQEMEGQQISCFLPLYKSVRRWKDRRKQIELPLFPGYVFVHVALRERLR